MGYGDVLGLGNQSLSDFLQTSDVGDLRNKYFSTIDSAGNDATTMPELDQGNLLWQGIIPTLAAALFTKGKSLAFSGPADTAVLANEQKRATEQQKMSVDAKLKAAGLLGDELTKRESLASAAAAKGESLKQSMEIAKMNDATRRDISSENNATRELIAGMVSASRGDAAAERKAAQDDKQATEQAQKFGKSIETELKNRKFQDRYEALQSAQSAMSQVEGTGGQVATLPMKEAITRYYLTGGRQAKAIIEGSVPPTLQGSAQATLNWLISTNHNTIPPEQMKGLRALVDAADIDLSNELMDVAKRRKQLLSVEAPLAEKRGGMDVYTDPSAMGYGDLKHLNSAAMTISPQKTYKTPNGATIPGSVALQRYANNPTALGLLEEVSP